MASLIFLGVSVYFGVTVLTGDTLASAIAALFAAIAAVITHKSREQIGTPPGSETVATLLAQLVELSEYQHRRNHDMLNSEAKTFMVALLIARHLGVDLPKNLGENQEN